MESNYYTPTIEEFYKGFEYEELEFVYTDKGWYTSKEQKWIAKTYQSLDTQSNYLEAWYLNERIKRGLYNSIRVKYLDRADIESLGFEFRDKGTIASFIKSTNDLNLFYQILVDFNTHKTYVSNHNRYFFDGYIKNKSELVKVLKMIGVL